jgi:hypothetical protein
MPAQIHASRLSPSGDLRSGVTPEQIHASRLSPSGDLL